MPPRIIPLIERLPAVTPFVGPEALERQRGRAVPRAHRRQRERVRAFARGGRGDGQGGRRKLDVRRSGEHDLKVAIARHHGVGVENVAVDSGIDALFGIVVRLTRRARRYGRDLARRLSDVHLSRGRLRRAAGARALSRTTARTPRRCSRRPSGRMRGWSISPIPTTRWARGGARRRAAADRRRARRHAC